MSNELLKRQKLSVRKTRRRKIRVFLIASLMIVSISITIVLTLDFLTTSNIFNLKEVIVKGNNLLPTSIIIKKAALPSGKNLFKLSTDIALDRLLELRQIETVNLKKTFPDTVVITVKERKPVALLLFKNKLLYADSSGKLISAQGSRYSRRFKNKNDYPVITGITENFSHEERTRFTKLSLNLLKILEKKSVLKNAFISEINVNRNKGLSVITSRNSIPLIFGFDDFEKKAIYLNYVLSDLDRKKIKVSEINLNFDKKIVVKKKR